MNLMELRLQKVLRENHADFVDSLSLSGIDLERGAWTSDAVEANARAGAQSLIRYVSREGVPARYQQAFLRIDAENLDEDESTPTMALIYAAYEWDSASRPMQSFSTWLSRHCFVNTVLLCKKIYGHTSTAILWECRI